MSAQPVREGAADQLEARLLELDGVRSVDLGGYPATLVVRCEAEGASALAAQAVREVVQRESGSEPEVKIEITGPSPRTKRARFESIEVSYPQPGTVKAVAKLGWQREIFTGEAEGEASAAGELRACASATARAIEQFAGGSVSFTLVGAKEVHVFDHDLVAVLLHAVELPEHRLIGTSIISVDRKRAAALAVLNATNRAVGNFVDSGGD